jgi:hypothetical protein
LLITEGVKDLADMFECYWLIDIVASYYPEVKRQEFQVWELTVNEDRTALVKCTDGNDRLLKQQRIPYTDFEADRATVWVEGNVILLPSEH